MVDVRVNTNKGSTFTYNVSNDTVDYGNGFTNGLEEMASQVGLTDMANSLNQEGRQYDEELRQQQDQEVINSDQLPLPGETDYSEDQEEPDEVVEEAITTAPKKRRQKNPNQKKPRSEERIEDLVSRYASAAQERDAASQERDLARYEAEAYKQRAEELERSYLELQHSLYSADIAKANDIRFQARADGDFELEKQAESVLSELQFEQIAQKKQLEYAQQQQVNKQPTQIDPREAALRQNFDTKELESPALDRWLANNPECNPYSPEYDEDYATEIATVKKSLNKWLTGQRQKGIIGEAEYYDILDESLDIHFGRQSAMQNNNNPYGAQPPQYAPAQPVPQQPMQPQQPVYNNGGHVAPPYPGQPQYAPVPQQQYAPVPQHQQYAPPPTRGAPQYNQQYNGGQQPVMQSVKIPLGNPPHTPVTGVNRAGYGNPSGGNGPLPQLSQLEREMALRMPLYQPNGVEITDPATKIHTYQVEASKMRGY